MYGILAARAARPPHSIKKGRGGRVGTSRLKCLAGQFRDYFTLSAHVITKSPNSIVLSVSLVARTWRAAPGTDPTVLDYIFFNSIRPRFPTQACFILSVKYIKHRNIFYFNFLRLQDMLPSIVFFWNIVVIIVAWGCRRVTSLLAKIHPS